MGILNIHEVTSWAFWMFRSCQVNIQKADVGVNIHEMTSWVFWIFKSWRHGHFEYLWGDVIGILNIHSDIGIFNIQNYVVFWIFIVMTSLQEYSRIVFWIRSDAMGILNIHSDIGIFNIHSKLRLFLIFIVMTSLQEYSKYQCHYEYSKYPWRHFVFKILFLNILEVTSLLWIFKYSKYPRRQLWIFPWR